MVDKMLANAPRGSEYVPKSPDVIAAGKMVFPGESGTLTFTSPTKPGVYPFTCTFPGHWRHMNGVIVIGKNEARAYAKGAGLSPDRFARAGG